MIRVIEDFKNSWTYEMEATSKLFRELTDVSLDQKVNPEGRALGRLAWHITTSIGEMLERVDLKVDAPDEKSDPPKSAKEIIAAYDRTSQSALELVTKNWNDNTLLQEDKMYGEMWKRGFTLSVLINHQIHHRGQMTVLMRQAGLKVPGIYGPAREEWASMGMSPMP
jgi:uncharacterized damage-inducible protein DinB